jgi:hypothetical protein
MDLAEIHAIGDRLAQLEPGKIPRAELGEAALACEWLRAVVEALDAAVLAELHERGPWAEDGALSGAAGVAARTGGWGRDVHRRQRTGLGLHLLPTARLAARCGRLAPEQARRLADCAHHHPTSAGRDEALLIGLAERLPASDFAAAAAHWCTAAADAEAPDPADLASASELAPQGAARSKFLLSDTLDGVTYLHGELRGEQRDLVVAALEGRVGRLRRARRDGDPSLAGYTGAELRAEALVDLLTQTQRREPSERSAPDRYRVAVVVRADGDPGDPSTVAEAIAHCDAPHFRAVLSAESEVLDIGRQSDQWPTALRRAITLRDSGCTFPGCDRPSSWCDVHHCQWWSRQGETNVDNGALLCRRHHTFLHANGWSITIPRPRGKPEVRRPDGRIHTVKRWPQPEGETG